MSGLRFLAALLLTTAVTAASTAAQGTGRITGTVRDSAAGRGLPSAQVRVVGTRLAAQTDDEGRFTITGVAAGTYSLEARRLGFRPATVANIVVTSQLVVMGLLLIVSIIATNAIYARTQR